MAVEEEAVEAVATVLELRLAAEAELGYERTGWDGGQTGQGRHVRQDSLHC